MTEGGSAGPLAQMLVGVRTIARLSAARTLVAYSVLVSFVYGTDTVLFVGVSAHRLGTGARGFGYLLAGLGVGGVLAAGAVNRLAGSRRLGTIILLGALGYTLPTALLAVIHSPVAGVRRSRSVRGSSTLVVDVLAITALQRAVASDQLARVFGVFFAFVLGAIALGTVLTPVDRQRASGSTPRFGRWRSRRRRWRWPATRRCWRSIARPRRGRPSWSRRLRCWRG